MTPSAAALEAIRYKVTRESNAANKTDMDVIQQVADFAFASSHQVQSEALKTTLQDLAHKLTSNAYRLARPGVPAPQPSPMSGQAMPSFPGEGMPGMDASAGM
jgi:hypothetical protein